MPPAARTWLARADNDVEVAMLADGTFRVGGQVFEARAVGRGEYLVAGGNSRTRVFVAADRDGHWTFLEGRTSRIELVTPDRRSTRAGHEHQPLSAPMPATVVRIAVAPGDEIERGQTLMILEAMKMELPIRSPRHGKVVALRCREGELVEPGVRLLDIE